MSRTQRKKKDRTYDNYPTPRWAIQRFLERWEPLRSVGTKWLEPCAGDGVIIETANLYKGGIDWTACDIRDTSPTLKKIRGVNRIEICDFVNEFPPGRKSDFDVAIMNPPFPLTMEMVEKCFGLADWVIALQRVNFMCTEDRNAFFKLYPPDLYQVPNRCSFTGDGKADSIEHGWHVWPSNRIRKFGLSCVLDSTPLEDRKLARLRSQSALDEERVFLEAFFQQAKG